MLLLGTEQISDSQPGCHVARSPEEEPLAPPTGQPRPFQFGPPQHASSRELAPQVASLPAAPSADRWAQPVPRDAQRDNIG
jgi:hypothetical protein